MNIPQLQVTTTKAQLGLTTQQPTQEIEQPKATLDIQQPQAEMTINTTKSRLSIDTTRSPCRYGLKKCLLVVQKKLPSMPVRKSSNGIARRAQDGSELMRIENGGNPMQSFAERAFRQPYSSLNIKFIPSYGSVKVSFEPGSVDIRVEPQKVINNSTANKPIHTYTPGKVTTELLQKPSIQIDCESLTRSIGCQSLIPRLHRMTTPKEKNSMKIQSDNPSDEVEASGTEILTFEKAYQASKMKKNCISSNRRK